MCETGDDVRRTGFSWNQTSGFVDANIKWGSVPWIFICACASVKTSNNYSEFVRRLMYGNKVNSE